MLKPVVAKPVAVVVVVVGILVVPDPWNWKMFLFKKLVLGAEVLPPSPLPVLGNKVVEVVVEVVDADGQPKGLLVAAVVVVVVVPGVDPVIWKLGNEGWKVDFFIIKPIIFNC